MVDGKYPLSNACGQLGQKYQEYHCSEEEKHMECPVDPNMSIKAVTHAKWYGAPGPLFCGPKSEYEFTGFWGEFRKLIATFMRVNAQASNINTPSLIRLWLWMQ